MKITTVGVLALQGDVREHIAAFRRCGAVAVPVRLAAEIEDVDALVIPGGESTTMGKLLRAFDLEDALRDRLADGMPTLTTCAGLILLSTTIVDGRLDQVATGTLDIVVRRNGWGSQVDSFEEQVAFPELGDPLFPAVFIRAPRIEHVGAQVEVLASLDGEAVAVGQGAHIGLTFHPEMTGDDRVHQLFLDRVGSSRSQSAA